MTDGTSEKEEDSEENEKCESGLSRRHFIGAAVGLSGAAFVGTSLGLRSSQKAGATTDALYDETIPFRGKHQAGVTNPSPANSIVAAFDIIGSKKSDLITIFQSLTSEIEDLTQSKRPPEKDAAFAPHDNLVNGTSLMADGLTINVSVGSSLFDKRFGLEDKIPSQLIKMPYFPNDNINASQAHGDLLVQICSHHAESSLRALRIIMKATRSGLVLKWLEQGFVQPNTEGKGKTSTRNLLGFKDGTANPDSGQEKLMDEIVWVQKGDDEPKWAVGGTYVVARSIRMFVEHWDRTSLDEQEHIFGRDKSKGAPMGQKEEHEIPKFHANPHGSQIKTDAHIRLANPRTKASEKNLILRRGFNYSRGFDSAGHLDQGLLFICFQRSLNDGFIAVQNRLNGEPLEEYIEPVGGGFYFTLPGVEENGYIGAQLLR